MEEQILIFRTSVRNARDIKHIAALFTLCPQIYKWNIDMEDWEKVLRIECQGITPTEISKALRASTFMHRNWNETEKTSNKLITRQVFYFLIIFFHSNLLHPSVDGYKSDVITYCKRFNSQCFVHWQFLICTQNIPLYFPQNFGELPKE